MINIARIHQLNIESWLRHWVLPTRLEIGDIGNICVGEGKIRAGQVDVFTIGRH